MTKATGDELFDSDFEPEFETGFDIDFESDFGSGLDATSSAGATMIRAQVKPKPESDREEASPWHVVLLDDDDHTFEYVIRMLMQLFGHTVEQALQTAQRVDREGRAVCMTTHRELAELKAEQIQCFGADSAVGSCAGAMSAMIEPALYGPDDTDDAGKDPDSLHAN